MENKGVVPGSLEPGGPIVLGGACDLRGAVSPNNGFPLTQHAVIAMRSPFFQFWGWQQSHMPLLYSWKCGIHLADFTYRQTDHGIEFVEYCDDSVDTEGFPYPGYPVVFPAVGYAGRWVTDGEAQVAYALNDHALHGRPIEPSDALWGAWNDAVPAHQFGGIPFLLDPAWCEKACPGCGRDMQMAATIGNDAGSPGLTFFGDDFVQLVYLACFGCTMLCARNVAG